VTSDNPKGEVNQVHDPFSSGDENDWDREVDQWDKALDLPATGETEQRTHVASSPLAGARSGQPRSEQASPLTPAKTTPTESWSDPMVTLMQEEPLELPDGPGEALGPLLGGGNAPAWAAAVESTLDAAPGGSVAQTRVRATHEEADAGADDLDLPLGDELDELLDSLIAKAAPGGAPSIPSGWAPSPASAQPITGAITVEMGGQPLQSCETLEIAPGDESIEHEEAVSAPSQMVLEAEAPANRPPTPVKEPLARVGLRRIVARRPGLAAKGDVQEIVGSEASPAEIVSGPMLPEPGVRRGAAAAALETQPAGPRLLDGVWNERPDFAPLSAPTADLASVVPLHLDLITFPDRVETRERPPEQWEALALGLAPLVDRASRSRA
jgi:hypothetical protein